MTDLSRYGKAGLALLGVHTALLFFPPIPPLVKGSIWSYVLAGVATILLLVEVQRSAPRILARWQSWTSARRRIAGLAIVGGILSLATALWLLAPALFGRISREEGLWESMTVFCYAASGIVLWQAKRGTQGNERKHWLMIVSLYVLLVLEEIDYLGIFGGMIGRIEGVYVGSPHDLVRLAAHDALSVPAIVLAAIVTALIAGGAWLACYLQPTRLLTTVLCSGGLAWALGGATFLSLATVIDAELFGIAMSIPTVE